VSGFDPSKVVATNGTVTLRDGNGGSYNLLLTPTANGTGTVTVLAGAGITKNGTLSAATTSVTNFSFSNPGNLKTAYYISGAPPEITPTQVVPVTVQFSDKV